MPQGRGGSPIAESPSTNLAWRRLVAPVLVCAVGLLLAHHEMLLSGFARIQSDPGDTRFNHYLMEHGLRWLLRRPFHEDLFSPPYFWPARNVLAYSDAMLGAVPAYAPWRLAFSPDTAYQLWLLTVGALNFAAAFALIRALGPSRLAASFGAALFAFGAPRINQTMHSQLLPHFWTALAAYALVRLYRSPLDARLRRRALVVTFGLSCAAQLWVGFYLGWFLGLALLLAALAALAVPSWRRATVGVLAAQPLALGVTAALAAALVAPMAVHYLEASQEVGVRSFEETLTMIPAPLTWLHLGRNSWLYGWMAELRPFAGIPMEHEQRPGVGLVTTALALSGFALGRRQPGVLVFAFVGAAMLLFATLFGSFTLWKVVYELLPGANAVRAVARICIFLLLPAGLGVALLLHWLEQKGTWLAAVAVAVGVLCLFEQLETTPSFDKLQLREDVSAIAERVDREKCVAFVFSPLPGYGPHWKYQIDAMWASMESGVPTMNGYSGNNPPHWPLGDTVVHSERDALRVGQAIDEWARTRHVDAARVCWVRIGPGEGPIP